MEYNLNIQYSCLDFVTRFTSYLIFLLKEPVFFEGHKQYLIFHVLLVGFLHQFA